MSAATFTALLFISTTAAAAAFPSASDAEKRYVESKRYVDSDVSCISGHAAVAVHARNSGFEQLSYIPIEVQVGANPKPSLIDCGADGYLLNGEKIEYQTMASYALAAVREDRTSKLSVLILSLVGANQVGVTVTHVPGFANQDECEKAGAKWKAGFDRASVARYSVCVEQTAQDRAPE
jgi:hypothetical protein